jgi:hypothetical protein
MKAVVNSVSLNVVAVLSSLDTCELDSAGILGNSG